MKSIAEDTLIDQTRSLTSALVYRLGQMERYAILLQHVRCTNPDPSWRATYEKLLCGEMHRVIETLCQLGLMKDGKPLFNPEGVDA